MANKLSHSAISKYLECPKSYEYYYKDRLRPSGLKSSLLFGSAIDMGIACILNNKPNWEVQFEHYWMFRDGDESKPIQFNPEMEYSTSDVVVDLLTDKELEFISEEHEHSSFKNLSLLDAISAVIKLKKQEEHVEIRPNDLRFYNIIAWWSLYRKGIIMLQAFNTEIKPKIKKVLALQKKVEITNEEGDSSIGYIDAIVEWEDGSIVVIDFKTAARPYDIDSVLTSPQLAAYIFQVENEYKTRKAGFIVLPKALTKLESKVCPVCGNIATSSHKTCNASVSGKRCNSDWDVELKFKCEPQILINEMPERTETLVMENYAVVNKMIKHEMFPRNVNACEGKYGRCQYFDVCWNNNLAGMDKPEDKK